MSIHLYSTTLRWYGTKGVVRNDDVVVELSDLPFDWGEVHFLEYTPELGIRRVRVGQAKERDMTAEESRLVADYVSSFHR